MITNTANIQSQGADNLSVSRLRFCLPVEGVPIAAATVRQPEALVPR